jgi:MYXO-CTERM domain-containing protein
VPDCSQTSDPTILEATMYPFQDCGETKKETLEPDDISGICTIYPTAKDPKTCAPVGSGGGGCCSTSDHPEAAFALAGLTMLLLRRRR